MSTQGFTDECFAIADEHLRIRVWQDEENAKRDGLVELCIGQNGRITLWASDSRVPIAEVTMALRKAAFALEVAVAEQLSSGLPSPEETPRLPAHNVGTSSTSAVDALVEDLNRRGVDGVKWLAGVVKKYRRKS